jgi:hypothetical protein
MVRSKLCPAGGSGVIDFHSNKSDSVFINTGRKQEQCEIQKGD